MRSARPNDGTLLWCRDRGWRRAWTRSEPRRFRSTARSSRPSPRGVQAPGPRAPRDARRRRFVVAAGRFRCRCLARQTRRFSRHSLHGRGAPAAANARRRRYILRLMICFDTNAVIAAVKGGIDFFLGAIRSAGATRDLAISSIVLFELRYGIAQSARVLENGTPLALFLKSPIAMLDFDPADDEEAGNIRATLERAGTPIGPTAS